MQTAALRRQFASAVGALDTAVSGKYSGLTLPSIRSLMYPLFSLPLRREEDVVAARRAATRLAEALGFDPGDQTRIATAVSEIVRNALRYATGGEVQFSVESAPPAFQVRVEDQGPGIANLDDVLNGRVPSRSGMGLGLTGTKRLMDRFSIESTPGGTVVVFAKILPPNALPVTPARVRTLADAAGAGLDGGLVGDVQRQNHELMRTLDELHRRQAELAHLNRELEDTNRGVVALYAELDAQADTLRRADAMKSRFLSNMTHEFRTPVNAIIGLSNLLRDDRVRQGHVPEPEIGFIRQAADQLWTLVNDLLDLAKVEAGKTVVRPARFEVQELFSALRGMLRPLLVTQSVALVFEDVPDLPPMWTDEAKVAQILRNLISNGLKFTERGEVRVSAAVDVPSGLMTLRVADTGIGISAADIPAAFEEFRQIEHRLQARARGTGLGLPLSRRLAQLLGGSLTATSEPGVGSVFSVVLPVTYHSPETPPAGAPPAFVPVTLETMAAPGHSTAPGHAPVRVLIIDDDPVARYMFREYLPGAEFEVSEAIDGRAGLAAAASEQPDLIVLDLVMPGMMGDEVFAALRQDPLTRDLPVVIASGSALEPAEERAFRKQGASLVAKVTWSRDALPGALRAAIGRAI
ncbi:MAG: ATP-binding protein [Acidobacteriota bacterium]